MATNSVIADIKHDATTHPAGILRPGQTFDSYIGHTVVNLSEVTLTKPQISALEKGLTFCPSPRYDPDLSIIWRDIKEFQRKLELKKFFHDNNENTFEESVSDPPELDPNLQKFTFPSKWKPPIKTSTIESFITGLKSDLLKFKPKKSFRHNLKKEEYAGLRDLQDNKEIVIKKADKGSAVVVMNRKDYLREGYRQLSDDKFYAKLDHDPTKEVTSKVTAIMQDMLHEDLISEKNFMFFTRREFSEGRFYLLPKIHKKGTPGRPICSTVSHPSCQISKWVDSPYRDTPVSRHFINHPNHSRKDLEFHIIEWCNEKPDSVRKERESFWIWKKKTMQKFGINQLL